MKTLLSLLLCLALAACALPHALPEATDLTVDVSEVVVIGKVELVPPLDPEIEQQTHWNVHREKEMVSRIIVSTAGEYKPVNTSTLKFSDFQNNVEAQWGVPFMVKAKRQRTYINGGMAHIDTGELTRLWFPGGYYFDVPKDATAVYIGTLRYYRNDFNTITKVEIIDERKDVASALKQSGSTSMVKTSLLKKVR